MGLLIITVFVVSVNCIMASDLFFYSNTLEWEAAKTQCETTSTQLIKIDSEQKLNEVKDFLQMSSLSTDIWIGLKLKTRTTEGTYIYEHMDGTTANYLPWYTNEPDSQSEHVCIRVNRYSLEFRTSGCDWDYSYICEGNLQTTILGITQTPPYTNKLTITTEGFPVTHVTEITNVTETTNAMGITYVTEISSVPENTNAMGITNVTETINITDLTNVTSTSDTGNLYVQTSMMQDEPFSADLSTAHSLHATTDFLLDICYPQGCSCQVFNFSDPYFIAMLNGKLDNIRMNLRVNKKNLSSFMYSKISYKDSRTSSTVAGAFGILFLSVLASSIIVPDVITFLNFLRAELSKRRYVEYLKNS